MCRVQALAGRGHCLERVEDGSLLVLAHRLDQLTHVPEACLLDIPQHLAARLDQLRQHDPAAGAALGLVPGRVTVMIHRGSRRLGHEVCTNAVAVMDRAARRLGIELPDRQLACAPLGSPEADAYLAAMAATAANFAWPRFICDSWPYAVRLRRR